MTAGDDSPQTANNHVEADQPVMKGTSGAMPTTTMDEVSLNVEDKSGTACITNVTAGDDSPLTANNHVEPDKPVMKGTSGAMPTTTTDKVTLMWEAKSGTACNINMTVGDDSPLTANNPVEPDQPVMKGTTTMDEETSNCEYKSGTAKNHVVSDQAVMKGANGAKAYYQHYSSR